MIVANILDEIKSAADALGVVTEGHGIGDGKSYEAWVLLRMVLELKHHGYDIEVRDAADDVVTELRLRGAPGHMKPSVLNPPANWPTHVFIGSIPYNFEIHLGLEVSGASGASHELDISVLPHELAVQCRDAGGGVYSGHVTHAVELKAYDSDKSLPMGFPRALLGTAMDLDPTWGISRIIFETHGGHSQRFSRRGTTYALLTTAKLTDNAKGLLAHHGMIAGEQVEPAGSQNEIGYVVADIRKLLYEP